MPYLKLIKVPQKDQEPQQKRRKKMNSLIQIAQSWYQLAIADSVVKNLMEKRLKVCDSCIYKKQLNSFGELIVTLFNEEGSSYYCSACNCPLAAKVAKFTNQCPKNFWKAEIAPEGYT
jgi:hypothetical protein